MESLHDGGEGGEEDDARQQEGDLPRPGGLVEGRVVVLREQGEDVVDGVGRREGFRGQLVRGEGPSGECQRRRDDPVQAEEGEGVCEREQQSALRCTRPVLLRQPRLQGGFGGGEGEGHRFEAGDLELEGLAFGVVGVASD